LAGRWQLFGFMDALREWMRHDPPPGDLLVKAAEFGAHLETNPTDGAQADGPALWYREIPDTAHAGWIVSITFTVEGPREPEYSGAVHCQTVCCVPHPQQELLPTYPPPKHH
jgi:hypothetical protein